MADEIMKKNYKDPANMEAVHRYRARHPDRIAESARKYRESHPEKYKDISRAYHLKAHKQKTAYQGIVDPCPACGKRGYLYSTWQYNRLTGVEHVPQYHVRHDFWIDGLRWSERCFLGGSSSSSKEKVSTLRKLLSSAYYDFSSRVYEKMPSDITPENYNKIEPFWPSRRVYSTYHYRALQGGSHTITIEARDSATNAHLPTSDPATYVIRNQAGTTTQSGTISQSTMVTTNAGQYTIQVNHESFDFAGWSDGNTSNPRSFNLEDDVTFVALFDTGALGSPSPTPQPTGSPTPQPTSSPTPQPTGTPQPTFSPTPTPTPTGSPSPSPSPAPGIPQEILLLAGAGGLMLIFFAKDIAQFLKEFGV